MFSSLKSAFLSLFIPFLGTTTISEDLALPVSQDSLDMIIYYEVGGKSYYNSVLKKPTVPAWRSTSSGVTIGFGYDLGYYSKSEIENTWSDILSDEEIDILQDVSGLKGKSAYYNGLPKVKHKIVISYNDAEKVFKESSLPKYTRLTSNTFEIDEDRLHPHSNGALTSIVFNRGSAISYSYRRKEMAWIKHNIKTGKEERVPSDIRSMKRLWDYGKLKGLHLRRDAEAKMFQRGLDAR